MIYKTPWDYEELITMQVLSEHDYMIFQPQPPNLILFDDFEQLAKDKTIRIGLEGLLRRGTIAVVEWDDVRRYVSSATKVLHPSNRHALINEKSYVCVSNDGKVSIAKF